MSSIVRVWDLPTRIFHWTLVVCVVALVTTAQLGGDAMTWHFRFGYAVLSLLLFRVIWGLVGGRWSRFASFVYSPATVWRYLRGQRPVEYSVGHTPLGAGSVLALLCFLLLQVASGLFSDDDISVSGPLAKFASNALVNTATWYHTQVGKLVLIVLVVLHVGAVLFYLAKKGENLIRPMIRGDKALSFPALPSRDDGRSRAIAVAVLSACGLLVAALMRWTEQ